MNGNITKALNLLSSISQRHPELHIETKMGEGDIAETWIQAILDSDEEDKRRAKEEGLFRIRWGGHIAEDYLYRLEDYEAVADYIEKNGAFPAELALEDKRGA